MLESLWQWCLICSINLLDGIHCLKCFSHTVSGLESTPVFRWGFVVRTTVFIYLLFFCSILAVAGIRTRELFRSSVFWINSLNHEGPEYYCQFLLYLCYTSQIFIFYFGSNYWKPFLAYVNARLANYMVCTLDECGFFEFPDPFMKISAFFVTVCKFSPNILTSSAYTRSWFFPFNSKPILFPWTLLMAYSRTSWKVKVIAHILV